MTTSVLCEEFSIDLPQQMVDPAEAMWEEIRWYLEGYAKRDPFSLGRAHNAERSLRSCGLSLALAICVSHATLKGLDDSKLLISIEYEGQFSLRMARIHWEILENISF